MGKIKQMLLDEIESKLDDEEYAEYNFEHTDDGADDLDEPQD